MIIIPMNVVVIVIIVSVMWQLSQLTGPNPPYLPPAKVAGRDEFHLLTSIITDLVFALSCVRLHRYEKSWYRDTVGVYIPRNYIANGCKITYQVQFSH